ncbi:Centromere protein S [Sphaceloma murrayae]|uniref:Centromere protein S n=1 Tax=Sphaceloma murrayae TaxID=2082308 RepID=A0A2K1QKN7_9PEZI|nr:Centromere protein S [Sphaceloma murrayae]
MPATPLSESEKTERLKSALWYSIGSTIDAISLEQDINATPQFIGALTELVWNQIQNAAQDVEAFTKHAGRKVIDTKDVMLLARRNESLASLLEAPPDKEGL